MASNNKRWGTTAAIVIPLAAAAWFSVQSGEDTNSSSSTIDSCSYDTLPAEAQHQIKDILTGAPADHDHHDGKHFGNYEELLPQEHSNYYREYTVKTPGINHRGERRIVVGGGTEQDPEVWYYTSDHFESFCSIPDAES